MFKKLAVVGVVVAIGLVALLVPRIRLEVPDDSLEAMLAAYHEDGWRMGINGPFNGVLLVARQDDVVFHEAYGIADAGTGAPLERDARFLIGSVSKQFTAMLVLQEVERGTIGLDQTVHDLVGWFPEEPGARLTVRGLLSHTSGLPHYPALRELGYERARFFAETVTPRAYAELIAQLPLAYEPGEGFTYSSFGYVLLGVILEEVTGRSYAELLRERITVPLGLDDTGFAGNDYVAAEVVPDYVHDSYGLLRQLFLAGDGTFESASFRDQSTTYATGGLHSTAADLFRWTQALRRHELLSPELTREMLRPNRWGYGYGIYRNPEDMLRANPQATLVAHGGRVTSYTAYVGMYDDGTTIVALTNAAPIDLDDVVQRAYVVASGREPVKDPIHPSLGSLRKFESEGGVTAFVEYHRVLSQRAGYPICPSAGTLALVVRWHTDDGRDADARAATEPLLADCAALDEELLNRTGYAFLRNDYAEDAVRLFRVNAELHPRSANVFDSLGEGLEETGDLGAARASYARAVELGTRNEDPALEVYRRNLARVERETDGAGAARGGAG